MRQVLITDFAWKDLKVEEEVLAQAGITIQVAKTASEEELLQLAPAVDGILTCWKPVSGKVIGKAERCLSVGRFGIGLDNIDVAAATEAGMIVTNVPAYCIDEVSDHAMALLLACTRKVAFFDRNIKAGSYNLQAGTPLFRLRGKTLGIVGFGRIGSALSLKARAFGLNITVYDPNIPADRISQAGATAVSFPELLKKSDFISIHVPLSVQTARLFDYNAFREMKPSAVIINTSRGDVIDSAGLLAALNEGLIAGAGLDVLSQEPPAPGDALTNHPKTVITPHAAFNSEESLVDLRKTAATQIADVLCGRKPQNIVNPDVLKSPVLRWHAS